MDGSLKPFDRGSFNRYDPKAKIVVKNFFKSKGLKLIDNPWTEHEADLYWEDRDMFVEVEILRSWKTGPYPINKPYRLFERKRFYLDQGKPVVFFVLSDDVSRAWCVQGHHLIDEYLQEVELKNWTPSSGKPKERMFYFPKEIIKEVIL